MGDEKTVLDAGLHEYGARRLIDALGLDPDMPLERLRADLAIAAKVRARKIAPSLGSVEERCYIDGRNDLLGFLLGDNP